MINKTVGHIVNLKTTDPRHFGGIKKTKNYDTDFISNFGNSIKNAMKDVNNLQVKSDTMNKKMIIDPSSVNVHDVMIASEKANLALNFTKAVVTKAVEAYKAIIGMR